MVTSITAAGNCSCGMQPGLDPRDLMTVQAGTVDGGLGACGYGTELSSLPQTLIRPQEYRDGFCPDAALAVGTMFPELADMYK